VANIGRFGPYVNHDGKFKSIPKTQSVFEINQEEAVALIAQAYTGPAPIAELGEHPSGEGRVEVFDGRYGPYVQHKKIRATLPKSLKPEDVTLEQALELLAAKEAKGTTKKTAAKKTTAKKKATTKKKAATKK